MNDKKETSNQPVIKLITNKGFLTLLLLAIGITAFSIIWNYNMTKVAVTDTKNSNITDYTQNIPVTEKQDVSEPTVKIEQEEEMTYNKTLVYVFPTNGQIQKEFSVEELSWDETMEDWRTHCGLDIEGEIGTEVDTSAEGDVIESFFDEMYGYVVKVKHLDGIETVYKNLDKVVVKQGDHLDQGQMIGTVGNCGNFEKNQKPHLHFEMINDEEYINPLDFIK